MFIMLDTANRARDEQLATHITGMHVSWIGSNDREDIFTEQQLKEYISHARSFNPTIDQSLFEMISDLYVAKRQQNKDKEQQKDY